MNCLIESKTFAIDEDFEENYMDYMKYVGRKAIYKGETKTISAIKSDKDNNILAVIFKEDGLEWSPVIGHGISIYRSPLLRMFGHLFVHYDHQGKRIRPS
jgi:hypothetical protein